MSYWLHSNILELLKDANAYERRLNLERNREERLRKLKEQRELDTVRFVRSMRMLHCDVRDVTSSLQPKIPSFRQKDDPGLVLYRKNTKSMREKANELERKLYFSVSAKEAALIDAASFGMFEVVE